MKRIVIMVALLFAASGCSDDSTGPSDDNTPVVAYHASTHPDSVVANFVLAWQNMDLAGYREKILYDGEALAPDGQAYRPFLFYCADHDPGDADPDSLTRDQEIAIAERIFAGQNGVSGVPGVRSIELTLGPFSDNWVVPAEDDVEGDAYPEGTLHRFCWTDMLVTLKSEIQGTDINGFIVTDRLEFHVIPVHSDDHVEYRLWKWNDIIDGLRTESQSWTSFKLLYLVAP